MLPKFTPKVFYEPYPEDLIVYVGEEREIYLEDYINWEVASFERVELLGSDSVCDGCRKSDTVLRFKADEKKQAGTYPIVVRCFDETTKSSKSKTFNIKVVDLEEELLREVEKHTKKTKPGKQSNDPKAVKEGLKADSLSEGEDSLAKGDKGKREKKEERLTDPKAESLDDKTLLDGEKSLEEVGDTRKPGNGREKEKSNRAGEITDLEGADGKRRPKEETEEKCDAQC